MSTGFRALAAHLTHLLHRVMGRGGPVLDKRTRARALRTPNEVRNVLRYVLLNRNRHVPSHTWVDECSTAPWFEHWSALREGYLVGL